MNKQRFLELLKTPAYDFLRIDPRLGKNIILLVLGGSHAYGLANENSDVDIRGVFLNTEDVLLGNETCERIENKETDTILYSLNHFIDLLHNCNPNLVEIIGVEEENILYISPIGRKLLDNKDLFITKKAAKSFAGYAESQLRRLTNALNEEVIPYKKKIEHMYRSVKRHREAFIDKFQAICEDSKLDIRLGQNQKSETDILIDIELKDYPLREFAEIINGMQLIIQQYDKLGHRNNKQDVERTNKHASHLVRLYKMGIEILRDGKINVYRHVDADFLKQIKEGLYMDESGHYKPEFDQLIDFLEKELDEAFKLSGLPDKPDKKKVNDLLIELNLMSLKDRLSL